MDNVIVKNTNKKGDTTITIKVKYELKKEWERFCAVNDVNQSQTLHNILTKLIYGE